MMKKTNMLKKNYEFRNVLSKGKYYSGENIEMFIKKSEIQNINQLGIAISVKSGTAVQRNKAKRIIREVYKNMEKDLSVGFSFVVLWKKKSVITTIEYNNVFKDFEKIFSKVGIIEGNK